MTRRRRSDGATVVTEADGSRSVIIAGDRVETPVGRALVTFIDPFGMQFAQRWVRGCLVQLRRDRSGPWVETTRGERIKPSPRAVLPTDWTAEERAAWVALARGYDHLTETELAIVLPGWDDVRTFQPPRKPGSVTCGRLWTAMDPLSGLPPMYLARLLARAIRRWSDAERRATHNQTGANR